MSTTVVLASDDVDLRERFAVVLAEADDLEIVDSVTDLERVRDALTATDADVLVLDVALTGGRMAETVRQLATDNPFIGIVVVTEDSTAETYAAALEAGARSTISAPFSLEELRGRLELAAQWGRTLRQHVSGEGLRTAERGRMVSVVGAKGGVGTTLLATLLAHESVLPGRGAVLVDLDLRGGNIGFYADVTARRSLVDLVEVARDLSGRSIREVAVDHASGVTLILAPEDVERADDMTGEAARLILAHLRVQFDVVVVDCGAQLTDATAMAVEMADEVVLVATSDVVALRGARRTLSAWERLSVRQPDDVRFVLNRVSRRVEVQPELARRVVGVPVAAEVPATFRELEGPLNSGRLMATRPTSVSRAVRGLLGPLGLREGGPAAAQATTTARPARRRRGKVAAEAQSGQVALETPVVVGLCLVLFLLCAQMLVWGASHILVQHAALEGARAAATTDDPRVVDRAVDDALPVGWFSAPAVQVGSSSVRVTLDTPVLLPGVGPLSSTSSASVLREEP